MDLLLVRGAPGVGKTAVVEELRRAGRLGAVVEVDLVRGMIGAVDWTSPDHHLAALAASRPLALGFLAAGFRPVAVVDTFDHGGLDVFRSGLPYALRVKVATLVADGQALAERLARRDGWYRDAGAAAALNDWIMASPDDGEAINTTDRDPAAVAAAIRW